MPIPTDYKAYVKYDLYEPRKDGRDSDWRTKTNVGSMETASQEAINLLSSPQYKIKKDGVFYELVDLKEVIVDGCSYEVTAGRCSGEVAIEKIKEIIKDHFKKI